VESVGQVVDMISMRMKMKMMRIKKREIRDIHILRPSFDRLSNCTIKVMKRETSKKR